MKCSNCGKILFEGEDFCTKCGTPAPGKQPVVEEAAPVIEEPVAPVAETPVEPLPVIEEPAPVEPKEEPIVALNPEEVADSIELRPAKQSVMNNPLNNNLNNTTITTTTIVNDYNNKNNKKSDFLNGKTTIDNKILVAAGAVVLLIIIVLVALLLTKGGSSSSSKPTTNDPGTDITTKKETVSYSGYTYDVPTGYKSNITDGFLAFVNQAQTSGFALFLGAGDYASYRSNTLKMKNDLITAGHTVGTGSIKAVDGIEYILYEVILSDGATKAVYGYTKDLNNSNQMYAIQIYTKDNTYDYSELKNITAVIKSATKGSQSLSANEIPAISTTDITSLFQ